MAVNRQRVGHTYPAYRYDVSREKIREYAAATGETDPRYFSDGEDCVAPPTFAACFTIVKGAGAALADPDLGLHPALVHTSQSYVFGSRPLKPGDTLLCTPRVGGTSSVGPNELITLEVDCRFADSDEVAVHSTTTLLVVGAVSRA